MGASLYIGVMEGLSEEYFYYGGMLLICASLPAERIIEIIKIYLENKEGETATPG